MMSERPQLHAGYTAGKNILTRLQMKPEIGISHWPRSKQKSKRKDIDLEDVNQRLVH
jgi:hypothetical protein